MASVLDHAHRYINEAAQTVAGHWKCWIFTSIAENSGVETRRGFFGKNVLSLIPLRTHVRTFTEFPAWDTAFRVDDHDMCRSEMKYGPLFVFVRHSHAH